MSIPTSTQNSLAFLRALCALRDEIFPRRVRKNLPRSATRAEKIFEDRAHIPIISIDKIFLPLTMSSSDSSHVTQPIRKGVIAMAKKKAAAKKPAKKAAKKKK
jgi:abortive infection bacteriophage resistance protein